jgi:hypothetical protein
MASSTGTFYDPEDVPDDEKVMDVTPISLDMAPIDHGTDDNPSECVTAYSLLVKLGLTDGTTPNKPRGRNSFNNSMLGTPETKATASTASPSMMDSPYSDGDDDHDHQNTFASFQSVQSTFTAIVDSLPDQAYLGNAYESFMLQTYLGNSASSAQNNEEHSLTPSQEEETQSPLVAESSFTRAQTNTANNCTNKKSAESTNEETLQPRAAASSQKVGVVSRQSHVLAEEKIRQKLTQLRSSLPTPLTKPDEEPKRSPVKEMFLSNSQSEKRTPRRPPVTTESSYIDAPVPGVSYSVSDTARTAVRRAEEDLKEVFAKLGFWGQSTVGEESSNSDQLTTSTSSSDQLQTSTSTGISSSLFDEGCDRVQPAPPTSRLHIPSSFNNDENNGVNWPLKHTVEVGGGNRPATLDAAARLSARPCVPEISRVAAHIGGAPTVPAMVSVVPRSFKTLIYVDPAPSEMTVNLGSSVASDADQSSFPRSRYSSKLDDPKEEVFGGMSVTMPAMSEFGGIVLVEAYDEIEAQKSSEAKTSPKGDLTTSKASATSWIIANKLLFILILLVTSAAIVAATLGLVVTNSI